MDPEAQTRAADAADPRLPISLSSEQPVRRWYGTEILSHAREAIDLEFARGGMAFLVGHDAGEYTRLQVGLIEDVALGKDAKLRGMVRFSSAADAQRVRQDMLDGIRPYISVGYRIDSLKLTSSDDSGDVYTADRWTPMEGSTVTVPADVSVGVGRATPHEFPVAVTVPPLPNPRDPAQRSTMDETTTAPAATSTPVATPPAAPAAIPVAVGVDHAARATALATMATQAGADISVLASALQRGLTPDQFGRELFDAQVARQTAVRPPGAPDLTDREQRQFSLGRALLAANMGDWRKAGFEREVSDSIAQSRGKQMTANSFIVPWSLRAAVTGNVAGTTSLGGAGVQTTVLDLIELLRNKMMTRTLGARVITGLTSNVTFPRQITANTLTWSGENPSAANTNTAATLNNLTLSPKTAMTSSAASRQLVLQASYDAEQFLRDDLATTCAVGLDLAGLHGTGSSNQPTGIAATSGIGAVTIGSNGGVPTWAKLVEFETTQATNNADIGSLAFLTTPGMRGYMKTNTKTTLSGTDFLWGMDGRINGYRAEVSTQVASNLTKGTRTTVCHGVFFGNWAELLIAEFGAGIEVIVDPYTAAGQNMIQFTAILMADIGLRHPASFTYGSDFATS